MSANNDKNVINHTWHDKWVLLKTNESEKPSSLGLVQSNEDDDEDEDEGEDDVEREDDVEDEGGDGKDEEDEKRMNQ